MTIEEVESLLAQKECESIEFKEAKADFNFIKLRQYVVAIANELGGLLVLGASNGNPRKIVGTTAYPNLEDLKHRLLDAVRLRIEVEEIRHSSGRLLVFHIPSRPLGAPLEVDGSYLMRSGESLVPMSPDQLKKIFAETGPDFSAEIIDGAGADCLDFQAVASFREAWARRTGNPDLLNLTEDQLLEDAELTVDGKLTVAALILLGRKRAVARHLSNAEVILEYRATESQVASSQRAEFKQGFLAFHDELWNLINSRNDVTSVREGLFRRDIPAFDEDVVREAILNAICHRDYRLGGSIFIHQYPSELRFTSPGGFPDGITPENVLRRQSPRNRRLAEACAKCGLVERSGQGMDRIFGTLLREGKSRPEFAGTDAYQVILTLRADRIDRRFLNLLDLAEKHGIQLNVQHLVLLDMVRSELPVPEDARLHVQHLINIGLLERQGHGRARKLILTRGMYRALGEAGVHTRIQGLDRETHKQLLLRHATLARLAGATLEEFRQVIPALSSDQIRHMVYELKKEGKVKVVGRGQGARWFVS